MRTQHYKRAMLAAVLTTAAGLVWAAPASADPPPPGCARIPIFGLNPYVLKICDTPILPDGTWHRFRQEWRIGGWEGTCGGVDYRIDAVSRRYQLDSHFCPPGMQRDSRDFTPDSLTPVEQYTLTADTIPPGEPGHLG